jgi:hypothetical protein
LIEEGYFFFQDNPLHGARVVYAPKDDSDLEFADTNQRMNVANQAIANIIDVAEYQGQAPTRVKMQEIQIHSGE